MPRDGVGMVPAAQKMYLEFRDQAQLTIIELARAELERLQKPGRIMSEPDRLCLVCALTEIVTGSAVRSARAREEYRLLAERVRDKREWQKQMAWNKKHGIDQPKRAQNTAPYPALM